MEFHFRFWFMLFGCLISIGCGPASPPVWNKDSRSFFYAQTDGSVHQYDLDKMASRTLLGPGQQQPRQVALGPKVPAICFAQAALGADSGAAQVGFASLLNAELSWSKLEVWGDPNARRDICPVSCYWCPTGRRVLLWYQQSAAVPGLIKSATPFGRFAVYDVTTHKLSELTTATPAVILGQVINASPICPDGSGYVAMKLADTGPRLFFVTWDGWEYPLAMDEEIEALLILMADTKTDDSYKMQKFFPLPQGTWSNNVLKFSLRDGTVVIEPKSRKVSMQPLTERQQKEFEQIAAADSADAPWRTIQVAAFQGDRFSLHARMNMGTARIDLVDSQEDRRRVILEGTFPIMYFIHHLFPSPDGKHILVSLIERPGPRTWIHVINSDGTILAKVDQGPLDPKSDEK